MTFKAELKAAEEQRQREEEEEKRKAAEKRREEKKLEREVRSISCFIVGYKSQRVEAMSVCVRPEGSRKTEAPKTASGPHESGVPTPKQDLTVTSRPGTMETPHSIKTCQHGGKHPISSYAAVFPLTLFNCGHNRTFNGALSLKHV